MTHWDGRQRYLYFAAIVNGGPVKVGLSVSIYDRRAQLQSWCPYEIEVIAATKATKYEELAAHRIFQAHNLRGEWYHPHADILAVAKRIDELGALTPEVIALGAELERLHDAGNVVWPPQSYERRIALRKGAA